MLVINLQCSRYSILCTSLLQTSRVVASVEATAKEMLTVICTRERQARGGPCPHCEASLFVRDHGEQFAFSPDAADDLGFGCLEST